MKLNGSSIINDIEMKVVIFSNRDKIKIPEFF